MLQLLGHGGDFLGDPQLIPEKDLCLDMFRDLLFLRTFDTEVLALQRAGRIAFCNPSTGQEANQIGTVHALSPEDWVFPSYRVAGVYLCRKRSPLPLLNQLYGNAEDLSRGTQLPMHFADKKARFVSVSSPIGSQIPQAVGLSLAAKLRKKKLLAITYFGDGATSSNDFHAGLNFAGVFKTPTIFYCENNQYALSVPVERQTASESLAVKGVAYGIPSLRIDGNDILAVYEATRQAVQRARNGQGPTFIEAVTYRLGLHSSSDDPSLYRPAEEKQSWQPKDPILRFRKFLQKRGWLSEEWEEQVQQDLLAQMNEAIEQAEQYPPPPASSLFDNVYSERTPRLAAQEKLLNDMLD